MRRRPKELDTLVAAYAVGPEELEEAAATGSLRTLQWACAFPGFGGCRGHGWSAAEKESMLKRLQIVGRHTWPSHARPLGRAELPPGGQSRDLRRSLWLWATIEMDTSYVVYHVGIQSKWDSVEYCYTGTVEPSWVRRAGLWWWLTRRGVLSKAQLRQLMDLAGEAKQYGVVSLLLCIFTLGCRPAWPGGGRSDNLRNNMVDCFGTLCSAFQISLALRLMRHCRATADVLLRQAVRGGQIRLARMFAARIRTENKPDRHMSDLSDAAAIFCKRGDLAGLLWLLSPATGLLEKKDFFATAYLSDITNPRILAWFLRHAPPEVLTTLATDFLDLATARRRIRRQIQTQ